MTRDRTDADFDLAIVGGGSAGYAAARTAAGHGLSTVVVEGADRIGGLCILRGCMPTKALLQATEVRHLAQKAGVWGIRPLRVDFDFKQLMARKDAVIADFASHRREQLASGPFEFRRAAARFRDPHTLDLSDGSRLTARHFIVATGSKIASSPLPDLESVGYLTSDDALRLTSAPRSLAVLGGGAVAMEFAQFFNRLDTEVTLIQRSSRVLRSFDADASEAIQGAFAAEGITLHTGTRLLAARREGSAKVVTFQQGDERRECRADEIFFALGRTPNTSQLNLDAAGVETDGDQIVVTPTQQTSAPHIYAAGDCCGPVEIVHVAIQQGELAAGNVARPEKPAVMDYRLLTEVVFTDPQVASVGLSEQEAVSAGIPHRTASFPFNDHGKSIIMDALHGHVKLIADPDSGEILGGSCVGPLGGELIHEIVVAMHKHMTVHELAATPHYHPTLAEIWTYPAEELADLTGR